MKNLEDRYIYYQDNMPRPWKVQFTVNYKNIHIGWFFTKEEATCARNYYLKKNPRRSNMALDLDKLLTDDSMYGYKTTRTAKPSRKSDNKKENPNG